MIRGEASTTIRQPSATVFGFIVDDFMTNYPHWSPEILSLRPLSDGVLRVGFVAEQTRLDQGRRTTSTFRVTARDHDCRLHIAGISLPLRISFELDAAGATTKITFAFELTKIDFFMRPFEKLIRLAIAEGVRGVVGNLERLLEAQLQPSAAPDQKPPPPRQTMDFLASKDEGLVPFVLAQILDTCVNGITLSEPDRGVQVTLRNYRKSGEMFLNRLSIRPLVDRSGRLIYDLDVQYEVTAQVSADAEIDRLRLQLGEARG